MQASMGYVAFFLLFVGLSAGMEHFIVVFHQNTTASARGVHLMKNQINTTFTYEIHTTFFGYSAYLSSKQLSAVIASHEVAYVEHDQMMHATQSCNTQNDAVWGINRISEYEPLLTGKYTYESQAGKGAEVFVIDTGIRITHEEFNTGRAFWGSNFVDTRNEDCNGHGTHVAGTVAGTKYGVAKLATVIAVKVLSCAGSGSNAGVIKGVQFAADKNNRKGTKAIANMSLGGGFSRALNDAVAAAVRAGVTFAVAAGNDNNDACSYSPASELSAIGAGATLIEDEITAQKDTRASFSNYGSCVKILAPGSLIKSAWYTSNSATNTISGTSMASPHVAGVAALYLGLFPNADPSEIEQYILSEASSNLIDLSCGTSSVCLKTPNKLLFNSC